MGTCCETICKHRILFPSIQHLAWLPQGCPQGKHKCGPRYVKMAIFCSCGSNNSDWETVEDRWVHAARGLKSIELSFHPCNTLRDNRRDVSRRNKNVRCGTCTCGSNNWETVQDRWVHAARGLASTELSFHSCNVLRYCHRGVPRANKKWRPGYVKITIFFAIVVRMTGKLL